MQQTANVQPSCSGWACLILRIAMGVNCECPENSTENRDRTVSGGIGVTGCGAVPWKGSRRRSARIAV